MFEHNTCTCLWAIRPCQIRSIKPEQWSASTASGILVCLQRPQQKNFQNTQPSFASQPTVTIITVYVHTCTYFDPGVSGSTSSRTVLKKKHSCIFYSYYNSGCCMSILLGVACLCPEVSTALLLLSVLLVLLGPGLPLSPSGVSRHTCWDLAFHSPPLGFPGTRVGVCFVGTWPSTLPLWGFQAHVLGPGLPLSPSGVSRHTCWDLAFHSPPLGFPGTRVGVCFVGTWPSTLPLWGFQAHVLVSVLLGPGLPLSPSGVSRHTCWCLFCWDLAFHSPPLGFPGTRVGVCFVGTWPSTLPLWGFQAHVLVSVLLGPGLPLSPSGVSRHTCWCLFCWDLAFHSPPLGFPGTRVGVCFVGTWPSTLPLWGFQAHVLVSVLLGPGLPLSPSGVSRHTCWDLAFHSPPLGFPGTRVGVCLFQLRWYLVSNLGVLW